MKNLALWTLAVLNVALVLAVASHLFKSNAAVAQVPAQPQATDDFLMVPGEINGGTNAIVYVIDERTHQLSSMSYDDSMRRLTTMPPRSMDRDFDALGAAGGGNRPRR